MRGKLSAFLLFPRPDDGEFETAKQEETPHILSGHVAKGCQVAAASREVFPHPPRWGWGMGSSGGPRLPGVGEGGEVQRLEAAASGEKKCKKFPESMFGDAVMGALSDPHQTK